MLIVPATSNLPLATSICEILGVHPIATDYRRFPDSEIFVRILENVRGSDVFVIQSISTPANDHLMELLITVDALRRGSAAKVTAVMPYFGYARQDRKNEPRTPITAKLVANLITRAGVDRVLTVDLHASQIQGFFDIPVDNLYARKVFQEDIRSVHRGGKHLTIVAPDVGGVARARALASRLEAGLAIVDKRRPAPGQSEVMNIIGDVKEQRCILVDDIADSAGTLCNAADALLTHGAKSVSAYAAHGVLSKPARDNIEKSRIDELITTNTIKQPNDIASCTRYRQLSVAPMIAEAIARISRRESVSRLFD
ncbi:MAG: ribose-phosphate pyrophosphokinase [Pseudomonadota bacterium]